MLALAALPVLSALPQNATVAILFREILLEIDPAQSKSTGLLAPRFTPFMGHLL